MPARRRRSISTALFDTTICANGPNWASCRSTLPRAATASGRATTSRWICGSASRPSAFPPAPASRWSKCRRDRRCWRPCWPKSTDPTRQRAGRSPTNSRSSSPKCRSSSTSTISIGEKRPRLRLSIDQDAARVLWRRAARRLRHHPDAVRRRIGRLFPPRRRPQPDRDRGPLAEARSRLDRGAGFDAGARQYPSRQQDGCRTGPGRQGRPSSRARRRSSGATAGLPTW